MGAGHPGVPRARPLSACELCTADGGTVILRTDELRVVAVDDADYPGFTRVIWNAHVAEMTELDAPQIARLMGAVFAVEDALRAVLRPDKVNLASLGNQVPHLHWHAIPRFADDAHFPHPIWGARQGDPDPAQLAARRALLPALAGEIRARLPRAPRHG